MRLVFMGTPDFAVPSLRALASSHEIFLVITQPDRPAGRGRKLQPPPVKAEALSLELTVLQTDNPNDPEVLCQIQEIRPQVIAVVAYGCILKKALLDSASIAPVNLHASLLPKYRGMSPINRAIMDGERHTGVTTMRMDEGIDTGPILLQERVEIGPAQTAGELSDLLADVGAGLLLKTVDRLEEGVLVESPQDDSMASYAKKLNKSDGIIPWDKPAERIVDHIRGVTPWPGAFTYFDGLMLKVLEAVVTEELDKGAEPGAVVAVSAEGPSVATGRGHVLLRTVCPQGKKPMSGASWARGKRDLVGCRFTANE